LAPTQNLRSTLGKPRTSRLALPTAVSVLLLGASLALSACGAQEAGAAAIVDGRSISDQDVQTVSDQLNAIAPGGQKISTREALFSLILAPYVRDEAARTGKTVSASEALKAIEGVVDPAPATIEFVEMRLAVQQIGDASKTSIVSKLRKAKISVNPRYGTFDAKEIALNPTSPNWIKATAPSPTK
jgi:hypothetical protein